MTDQTPDDAPEVTELVSPTGNATEPDTGAQEADEPTTGNAEAAKYRRRLREAEAERDNLAAIVENTRRQMVERMLADSTDGHLGDPTDLWRGGVELAELVDEAGAIDPAKVDAAQARVIAEHPSWKQYTFPDLGQGARGKSLGGQADLGKLLRDAAG